MKALPTAATLTTCMLAIALTGCLGEDSDSSSTTELAYPVIDTMQSDCYDTVGDVIECGSDADLIGQDAEYTTTESSYTKSDEVDDYDTTVTDNITGLVWTYKQSDDQYNFDAAVSYCEDLSSGGYDDWRLPNLKELYSLANFNGALDITVNDDGSYDTSNAQPYLDTDYFEFNYVSFPGPFATQTWSSSEYDINLLGGHPDEDEEDAGYPAAFGFNFADGHIKAYGTEEDQPGLFIRCVRSDDTDYAVNDFELNETGTIVTDNASGLMWQQDDGGDTYSWGGAMAHCEALELEGYDDWRLPDNKELQSIVDYDATETPAINTDYFSATFNEDYGTPGIYSDEGGDYGWYWTSTTIGDFPENGSYIAFGRAYSTANIDAGNAFDYSEIEDAAELAAAFAAADYYDYHGAGAQRSDPKDPSLVNDASGCSDYACDEERGYNYARCVRGGVE
ncbi:DUF1566 domain-containing protein [Reinekea marinisedimentorum]|uniref:Uncharacterized protein DUF1566 n=1 Tax=Reinekea marinisedimentorum TaxID=230495 RepID=A0A4V2UIB4_9GAMM|nr:DUF1566 domain-containing protein [Reinekea marinisedimentorum]TCS35198.1 uncharacterized protein DUF1566 [Reinekea marinisedimentorum]